MLRRLLFIVLLALLMYSPAAVSADIEARTGKGIHIWFDTGGPVGGTYNTVVYNGAKAAANDIGAKITFVYSDWSPEKMIENFKKALSAKPTGIVIMGHPGDAAYMPFIKEARQSGIRVTAVDTPLPKNQSRFHSQGFGYVGPDAYNQGTSMARECMMRFGLKKGDRVFVWGLKRLPTRGLRATAILDVFEKEGVVVDYLEISPEVDKDPSLGTPIITGYLAAHPDCKAMVIDHGALTAQMENFLRAAGVTPDGVAVAGFSLSPATAAAIEKGYVDLIGDAQPFLLGYFSVLQIALTEKYGFSGLTIDTGGGFVSADNLSLIAPLAKKGLR